MKAPPPAPQKLAALDPKIEEALRSAARLGKDLSPDHIKAIQELIWGLPPETHAIQEVLSELAWDLEFTRDGSYRWRERALEEITATLKTIEQILWLEKEVGPVYDAMQADPGRGIPARDVFAAIRARHALKQT